MSVIEAIVLAVVLWQSLVLLNLFWQVEKLAKAAAGIERQLDALREYKRAEVMSS